MQDSSAVSVDHAEAEQSLVVIFRDTHLAIEPQQRWLLIERGSSPAQQCWHQGVADRQRYDSILGTAAATRKTGFTGKEHSSLTGMGLLLPHYPSSHERQTEEFEAPCALLKAECRFSERSALERIDIGGRRKLEQDTRRGNEVHLTRVHVSSWLGKRYKSSKRGCIAVR